MNAAKIALATAIEKAKSAKTLKDACGVLGSLTTPIQELQLVTPPKGFERPFSEERNGLATLLDVMQDQRCADDSEISANTIRAELEDLRKGFVRLQQIGAKK